MHETKQSKTKNVLTLGEWKADRSGESTEQRLICLFHALFSHSTRYSTSVLFSQKHTCCENEQFGVISEEKAYSKQTKKKEKSHRLWKCPVAKDKWFQHLRSATQCSSTTKDSREKRKRGGLEPKVSKSQWLEYGNQITLTPPQRVIFDFRLWNGLSVPLFRNWFTEFSIHRLHSLNSKAYYFFFCGFVHNNWVIDVFPNFNGHGCISFGLRYLKLLDSNAGKTPTQLKPVDQQPH